MIGAKPRGFTLLEMVVAVGLFTTFMVAATGIFLATSNRHNKLAVREEVASEIKFALDQMAAQAKVLTWEYQPGVWPQAGVNSGLRLIDEAGQSIIYRFGATATCTDCLAMQVAGGQWQPLISSDTVVTTGSGFYIWPTDDPWTLDALGHASSNVQPQVTIFLTAHHRDDPEATLTLQTTVTSRRYVR